MGISLKHFACTLLLLASVGTSVPVGAAPREPQPLDCNQTFRSLQRGLEACNSSADLADRFYQQCVAKKVRYPDTDLNLALRHTFAQNTFDRGMTKLYRLKPVANYQSQWSDFFARWTKLLAADPELMQFDQSEALGPGSRGALAARLTFMNSHMHFADAGQSHELLVSRVPDITRPSAFYALAVTLFVRALQSDTALNAAKSEMLQDAGAAKSALSHELDFYYSLYPELQSSQAYAMMANAFQMGQHLSGEDLGRAVFPAAPYGTPDQRFNNFLRWLDARFAADPSSAIFLANAETIVVGETSNFLQKMFSYQMQIKTDPSALRADGLALYWTQQSLLPAASPLLFQSLVSLECHQLHQQREWATFNSYKDRYGSDFLMASMILSLLGGVDTLAVRFGVRFLAAELVETRELSWTIDIGARVAGLAGAGSLVIGTPLLLSDAQVSIEDYNQKMFRFYTNPYINQGVLYHGLEESAEDRFSTFENLSLFFAPLGLGLAL